jgi:glutaconate CoA-transferase, subunit A
VADRRGDVTETLAPVGANPAAAPKTRAAEALAARIPDGATIAMPPDYAGGSLATVRGLVRRGARDLTLLGVPQLGLAADILIGAGCVCAVETAAISLGEQGLAPAFGRAFKAGAIEVRDSTCPAIHSALQAAEKGLPFMPVRGVIGSGLIGARPDWRVTDNPFPPHDPLLLVPAIRPDVALFHAPLADREGNVWIGVRRELMLMAHAAKATLATAERIAGESLLADPVRAAGTIPALYVSGVVEAPGAARPLGLFSAHPPDLEPLAAYARGAATEGGFQAWLEEWLERG